MGRSWNFCRSITWPIEAEELSSSGASSVTEMLSVTFPISITTSTVTWLCVSTRTPWRSVFLNPFISTEIV